MRCLLCNQGFQTNLHHIGEGVLAFFCSSVFIWIDQAIRNDKERVENQIAGAIGFQLF